MQTPKRRCRLCKKPVYGRTDKVFCTIACKNEYHVRLRRATAIAVRETDKILHRNRSILLECLGKKNSQKRISRSLLDKKKFNFQYHTSYYVNSEGEMYHLVYDFAWLEYFDGTILVIRRN